MCIIAVAETRRLTDSEIECSFRNNSDGAGIGWVDEKGNNNFIKGIMNVNEFKEIYKDVKKLPHVAHFRLSTAGGVEKELTHPFVVSEDSPLYLEYKGEEPILFHNGVLSQWQTKLVDYYIKVGKHIPEGHWSDTRFIAVLVNALGKNYLRFESMGRFAVLKDGIIHMHGSFTKEDGVHFSSTGHKGIVTRYNGYGYYNSGNSYWGNTGYSGKVWRNGKWIEQDKAYEHDKTDTAASLETKPAKLLDKLDHDEKEDEYSFGYDNKGILYYDTGEREWRRSYKEGGRWIDEPIGELPETFKPGPRDKVEAAEANS